MSEVVDTIGDVEFGAELPTFAPDTGLENVKRFGREVGWGGGRFTDHEVARKEASPGRSCPA